ncbi:UNVERIFIED_CONTAM: hypothetical protein Cloal_0135 [Acetivibrio alkalicellulosi]
MREKILKCCNCQSNIFMSTHGQISKMNGLSFFCEDCGYINVLRDGAFKLGKRNADLNILSIYQLI